MGDTRKMRSRPLSKPTSMSIWSSGMYSPSSMTRGLMGWARTWDSTCGSCLGAHAPREADLAIVQCHHCIVPE